MRGLLPLLLALGACAPVAIAPPASRAVIAESALPPMKTFARGRPAAPGRSNANIAEDFLSLHFELESGRSLPVFTRFETPITVAVTGAAPPSLGPDLRRLLARLRSEAGIDIRQVDRAPADITIEAVSRTEIRRALPQAACFVVPNVSSLAEFRRFRRAPATNWAELRTRERMGIFLPHDASPQEVRDCLHEELAQAIGPLNDLYRLPDSVFNDDNVHTVLTGFDMLILRAGYAPELRSGMSRREVAARLPAILARLNPAGQLRAPAYVRPTPRAWIDAVQVALGPGSSSEERRAAAARALALAERSGWTDHRRAFSHYMVARLMQGEDAEAAQDHYAAAMRVFDVTPGTELHRAYIATQMGAYAISRGDGRRALDLLDQHIPRAEAAENAALLATLLLLKAEALRLEGREAEARAVRLDSLGWARYGFGPDWAVRAKMDEISALSPLWRMEDET